MRSRVYKYNVFALLMFQFTFWLFGLFEPEAAILEMIVTRNSIFG